LKSERSSVKAERTKKIGRLITLSKITSPKVTFLIKNYLWHHLVKSLITTSKTTF